MSSLQAYLDEWDLLTPEEKAYVANGCGPKFGNIAKLVSRFCELYAPACDVHDWLYWSGGPLAIKKLADKKLKEDVKGINSRLPWYKRYALSFMPSLFYWLVRTSLGDISFYRASYRRDRYDLRKEMANATI